VRPDFAFFGQKDAQQAAVIKKMVKDLNMPLEIVVCPTVREQDGLAVSSRNKYLDPQQREDAVLLYKSLRKAREMIESGIKDIDHIKKIMNDVLEKSDRITVEYIEIVDPDNIHRLHKLEGRVLIAIAARVGKARLIDNILVDAG
jgi:pantoate--beta-alanine ligase